MSLKKSITPLIKIAFVVLLIGATLLLLDATTGFLPVWTVTFSFVLLFGGAGTLSLFWKPRAIPQDREVMLYTCAKCQKKLPRSEVYVLGGKNIPENHRCVKCYVEDKPKGETQP